MPAGNVAGLALALGDKLVVRDEDGVPDPAPNSWLAPRDPIPVTIQNQLTMSDGGILELLFDADPWDSLISFQSGIPVQLGGTLELNVAPEVDVSSRIGRKLRIFDWTGVSPIGQFQVVSPYAWDLSKLYTTGEVTLAEGDFDLDGRVNGDDYLVWQTGFGTHLGTTLANGDANQDGDVDGEDFLAWQQYSNSGVASTSFTASVPEPSAILLASAALAVASLSFGRRRSSV